MMSPYDEKHSAEGIFEVLPEDPIRAAVHIRDGAAVLAISGALDGASAAAFKRAISAALASGSRHLVVDFSDVDFLGSAGVSVLLEGRRRLDAGHRLALVYGPITRRTIEILGLSEILSLHATLDEALRAVTAD